MVEINITTGRSKSTILYMNNKNTWIVMTSQHNYVTGLCTRGLDQTAFASYYEITTIKISTQTFRYIVIYSCDIQ